jgi:hypothetical protein
VRRKKSSCSVWLVCISIVNNNEFPFLHHHISVLCAVFVTCHFPAFTAVATKENIVTVLPFLLLSVMFHIVVEGARKKRKTHCTRCLFLAHFPSFLFLHNEKAIRLCCRVVLASFYSSVLIRTRRHSLSCSQSRSN